MIAAVSDDGIVSREGGGIPWHLPRDIRHFRREAAGKHLLLGRKTFEEMSGWFTDQTPLVLTRDPRFLPPCGRAVASVQEALAAARGAGAGELLVCGGGETYAAAMPLADVLILTRVHTSLGGGARFPAISAEWRETSREKFPADPENGIAMTFLRLERRRILPPTQPTK